jgi:small subunit ribosomal protein S12
MVTFRQLFTKHQQRQQKYHRCRTPALRHCPQKKGVILGIVIITPKKPNSAKRHIARLKLSSGKRTRAAIPGEYSFKSRDLKQFSKVLIRGGRTRDIIGIRYKIILGHFDAKPLFHRKTSRSKYGVKKY